MLDGILKRLTSNYKKTESNVRKFMEIVADELDEVDVVLKTVEQWRDIDIAEGDALDLIGRDVGQLRGEVNDETYRIVIKTRISRNKAVTTYNDIVNVLAFALDADPTDIKIEEGPQDLPQYISVIEVPLESLLSSGLTGSQLARLISKIIAAGIGLNVVEFFGTFEFVATIETDFSLGFSDISMTDGGTLGGVFEPSVDPSFPF